MGVDPYPYSFPRTHLVGKLLAEYSKLAAEEKKPDAKVAIAGRIMLKREMGKASFADVMDETGRMQIYVRKDDVKDKYKLFRKLDVGDWIGVKGYIFKTRTGQLTVYATDFDLLAKSIRPLPEKFHGLKDQELKYRKRELDLIMSPESRRMLQLRAKVFTAVREFLNKKGYLELDTPTLQTIYGGAMAKPFKTYINAWDMDLYLSVSPELFLKRLVIGGMGPVYTLCKNFRNEGVDKTHNPEFSMMEVYVPFVDYNFTMKLVEDLFVYVAKKVLGSTKLKYQGKEIDLKAPWPKLEMKEAIKKYANMDVDNMSDAEIKDILSGNAIELEGEYNRGLAIAAIFEELCEHKLVQPVHLIHHPKETIPLCKTLRGDPTLLERYESYINGWEMCNGYSEMNDPVLQRKLLVEQAKQGRAGAEEYHPVDEDFLEAVEIGMPPMSGVGVGVERMVVLFADASSIRDTIPFPTMKPTEEHVVDVKVDKPYGGEEVKKKK